MDITHKQFNSLKQLDRIEYRQKQDRIMNTFGDLFEVTRYTISAFLLFLFGGSILTSSLFGYKAAQTFFVNIANFSHIILALSILAFFYDLSKRILRNKVLKELNSKYFNVEVKNAKKRR